MVQARQRRRHRSTARQGGVRAPRRCRGNGWHYINNDCVNETARCHTASGSSSRTSFSTQYKYSDRCRDFGHADSSALSSRRWTTSLHLAAWLQPGRVAAIREGTSFRQHDRTWFSDCVPGSAGLHHALHAARLPPHGDDHGRHRCREENAADVPPRVDQRNRDSAASGVSGCLVHLLFRKPPTDSANASADAPIVKSKEEYARALAGRRTRSHRSSGNRLTLACRPRQAGRLRVFQLFRRWSLENVYDHETHIALSATTSRFGKGSLPPGIPCCAQPQSVNPDRADHDVAGMRICSAHIHAASCRRVWDRINIWTRPRFEHCRPYSSRGSGMKEVSVRSRSGGLGAVPPETPVKPGRRGFGTELSHEHYAEAIAPARSIRSARRRRCSDPRSVDPTPPTTRVVD